MEEGIQERGVAEEHDAITGVHLDPQKVVLGNMKVEGTPEVKGPPGLFLHGSGSRTWEIGRQVRRAAVGLDGDGRGREVSFRRPGLRLSAGNPPLLATRLLLSRTASSVQRRGVLRQSLAHLLLLYAKVKRPLYIELPMEDEVSRWTESIVWNPGCPSGMDGGVGGRRGVGVGAN